MDFLGKYIWYAEVDFRCVYDALLGVDHAKRRKKSEDLIGIRS